MAFDAVGLRRGDHTVLRDISLTLAERRVGLIGDNGSGKSSLARLLNGLLAPSSGQLRVYGHDSVEAASQLPSLVGFLFQNPDHQILFPTVLEELAFGLVQLGQPQRDAEAQAREWLESRGCGDWASRPAQALSEGEKQRLCLWAIQLMCPPLLVLDETFASLDLGTRLRLLRELCDGEQQLLMITHDLELLQDFDRVIWLERGAVRDDGAAADVLEAYRRHARAGL